MPQPTASDVHVNAPLTNISIAYMQDQTGFVSDKVFPIVPVSKQSDRYFTYDKQNWFQSQTRVRAPGSESAGSGFNITNTANYFCDVYAMHKDVDDQIRANADAGIDMDRDAVEFVMRDMMLQREIQWATTFFTTSTWTGSTTAGDITPGTLWSAGGSTPIEDIRAQATSIKKKTGFRPNVAVMGQEVWDIIADHPDFLDRIKYTRTGIVGPELLASVLGFENVYVADAIQDSADEGGTASMGFVFGKDMLIAYRPRTPGLLTPSAGYTFAWTGYTGAGPGGQRISRFRMEHLKSDRVEGEMAFDQKLIAADLGAYFDNVVA